MMIDLKNKKTVIGMIHLKPTFGFKGFTSIEDILKNVLADLESLENGGIDAIMIENNYDLPHKIKVGPETVALVSYIIQKVKEKTNLPIGINLLWNDYEAALALAKIHNCDFVRIPVFVDDVNTEFGRITGDADKVVEFRKRIGAENILLLTDIEVKHAELINKRPICIAALEAAGKGSDGLIVTGRWTGEPPSLDDLKEVKTAVKTPVIIGSGADKDNINELFRFADAVIVSTSLKEGEKKPKEDERNIKSYNARVDKHKVDEFMAAARGKK